MMIPPDELSLEENSIIIILKSLKLKVIGKFKFNHLYNTFNIDRFVTPCTSIIVTESFIYIYR